MRSRLATRPEARTQLDANAADLGTWKISCGSTAGGAALEGGAEERAGDVGAAIPELTGAMARTA